MRIAVLSDIHANYEALSAVLEVLEHSSVDAYYCLGDTVGYGGSPNECAPGQRSVAFRDFLGERVDAARNVEVPGKLALAPEPEPEPSESEEDLGRPAPSAAPNDSGNHLR